MNESGLGTMDGLIQSHCESTFGWDKVDDDGDTCFIRVGRSSDHRRVGEAEVVAGTGGGAQRQTVGQRLLSGRRIVTVHGFEGEVSNRQRTGKR